VSASPVLICRPGGAGLVITALINGRLVDYFYRKEEKRIGGDFRKKPEDFRLERSRFIVAIPSYWQVFSRSQTGRNANSPTVSSSSPALLWAGA
jgi:hypothetical protein